MDLLEYQAKELFQQVGIPVLPSQRIHHPRDLKGLKVPYPIVLKSQVYTGGRGKAGGVRFVENTIDAVAAAQTIFHLPIMGQYPEVLLAEAKYETNRELYLAVVLDRSTRRPLLLGSMQGGEEVESAVEHIQQVTVDQEFSSFYARRLAIKIGLQGPLIQTVSGIVEKMYQLFIRKDLDLVEINPLAVDASGAVMALDGKIAANDDALARHTDLAALRPMPQLRGKGRWGSVSASGSYFVEQDGAIVVLCNGGGLTMATLDLVHRQGGKSASFLNLGSEGRLAHANWLREHMAQSLERIGQSRGVKVVLINLWVGVLSCNEVAEVIVNYVQRRSLTPLPQLVVRLMGSDLETARETLNSVGIKLFEELDEAVAQAVSLEKSKAA